MTFKNKELLTDIFDTPIPQYYDEKTESFKPNAEGLTEETGAEILKVLKSTNFEPVIAPNFRLLPDSQPRRIHDFNNGFFYGSGFERRRIFKSANGLDWTEIHDFGAGKVVAKVIVSDTARIVVAMEDGDVFVSDENEIFGSTPAFQSGRFVHQYGHFKHANFIGLSVYGRKGVDEAGGWVERHEAWLSVDNGESFTRIFNNGTLNLLPPLTNRPEYHIHDIEYDPYNGYIYIWNGDFGNEALNYSKDLGATWHMVGTRGAIDNVTEVLATERGIALGADAAPGGYAFIHLDRTKDAVDEISLDNYDKLHWKFGDIDDRYIASQSWVDREKGIYITGFVCEFTTQSPAVLAFSRDGYHWNVLAKSLHIGHLTGFESVVYGNGIIMGTYTSGAGTYPYMINIGDLLEK